MGTRLRETYTTVILLLPILSQYESGIPKLSLGDLALLLAVAVALLYSVWKKCMPRIKVRSTAMNPFLWFAAYVVCGSMLSSVMQYHVSMSEIIGSSMRFIFYLFCACVMSATFFDFDYFMKKYRTLVIFATVFIIVQTLLFYWQGYVLFGTIPGLRVSNPGYDEDVERRFFAMFYRPSSIFLEPGYYAQFVLPYLAHTLFNNNERQKHIKAIVPTLGCILSTSGQGIMLSLVIWAMYFAKNILNLKARKINLRVIIVCIMVLVAVIPIAKTQIMQRSLQRLFSGPSASSSSRIYRGFAIYRQLKPIHKIIGVGYGHVGVYLSSENIYTKYCGEQLYSEYMNSIADILVSLGLVGFILFLWIIVRLCRITSGFHRICACILLLLSAVGACFTGPNIVFYLSMILGGYSSRSRTIIPAEIV